MSRRTNLTQISNKSRRSTPSPHASVGVFHGAALPDAAGLLEGAGACGT
jgi:hypothetical protein